MACAGQQQAALNFCGPVTLRPYLVDTSRDMSQTGWNVMLRRALGAAVFREPSRAPHRAQMQQLAVSSYVKRRFGEHGLRLWRLLTECPYLPLDQIERHALIGLRETRTLVYSLFAQGYVAVQELPKSAERIPSRTLYLYYTTAKITYTQFITDTYAAAGAHPTD